MGLIGNGATVVGDFVVPRVVWWALVAVGLVVAQYRAYGDVSDKLADTRAQHGDLDSVQAKRAWLAREQKYARGLIDEIGGIPGEAWYQKHQDLRFRDLLSQLSSTVSFGPTTTA